MKDFSGVYLIQCIATGKGYIGCSANVNTRLKDHKSDLRRGVHINVFLQRAWNKYGEGSFQYIVLLKTTDIFKEEIRLIKEHRTFGKGYNLTPGGEGVGSNAPEVCARRVATFKANYTEEDRVRSRTNAKNQFANMSIEDRIAFALKGSEAAKRKIESLTPEEKEARSKSLSEYSSRRWAKLSAEERTIQAKALYVGKTTEEKRASAMKSWETRRKNKESLRG